MKGQEAISAILITGILLGVVGSIYLWGIPLIEKNMDFSVLESAEGFMRNLDEKINGVANHGGREQIEIPLGVINFESDIDLEIETRNTIYASEAWIPLGKNECTKEEGKWGIDDPDILCMIGQKVGEKYKTKYNLRYIELKLGIKSYKIELVGEGSGREKNSIIIERTGTQREGDSVTTLVSIKII